MSNLFKDKLDSERKAYLLGLTEIERKMLHDEANARGVHISVLIRRCLRVCLVDKRELFNLFQQ